MAKRYLPFLGLLPVFFLQGAPRSVAQQDSAPIRVNVVLVQLSIAVTDNQGHYIGGLKPEDFVITEDNIPEKIAAFDDGGDHSLDPSRSTSPAAAGSQPSPASPASGAAPLVSATPSAAGLPSTAGASVYVLFDTSNYMYRGFVFAQDAIADFVRSLEGVSRVALYSYSRNLSRITPLTADRTQVLRGVRSTVAGDDEAMYNSLLLTVKDAAQIQGRKAIVVFSNGPDNASMVPPEDVAELAQSTGTIIYMMSTREAQSDPVSSAAFERMSKATGGKSYFAKNWKDEKDAFQSIKDDLAHLYSISYYPAANPNRGWRNIKVRLAGKNLQKYHIRTREGYRLLQLQAPPPPLTTASTTQGTN